MGFNSGFKELILPSIVLPFVLWCPELSHHSPTAKHLNLSEDIRGFLHYHQENCGIHFKVNKPFPSTSLPACHLPTILPVDVA